MIGLDANAAGMAEVSRRAAASPSRGGAPNALFVVAAAEQPPAELLDVADEVTVQFPWGSLLRGALALDADAACGIAGLLAPGGSVHALISVAERDVRGTDLRPLTPADRRAIAARWAAYGLTVDAFDIVTPEDVAATGSTWGRRLLSGRGGEVDRVVWRLDLRRIGLLDASR